jgi:hypothetical protein
MRLLGVGGTNMARQEAEECPRCRRKTFRCYLDAQSGMFGRCSWPTCKFVQDYEEDEAW